VCICSLQNLLVSRKCTEQHIPKTKICSQFCNKQISFFCVLTSFKKKKVSLNEDVPANAEYRATPHIRGYGVELLVKELCYKPEDRGFDSRDDL
jgi:hypothetical protein